MYVHIHNNFNTINNCRTITCNTDIPKPFVIKMPRYYYLVGETVEKTRNYEGKADYEAIRDGTLHKIEEA